MLCLSLLDRAVFGGKQAKKTREILGHRDLWLYRLVDALLDLKSIANRRILTKPVEPEKL